MNSFGKFLCYSEKYDVCDIEKYSLKPNCNGFKAGGAMDYVTRLQFTLELLLH